MLIAGGWPLLLTYQSVWSSQRIPVVMPLDLHAPPATVGAPDAPPDDAVIRAAPVVSAADGPLPDDAEGPFSGAVALPASCVGTVDRDSVLAALGSARATFRRRPARKGPGTSASAFAKATAAKSLPSQSPFSLLTDNSRSCVFVCWSSAFSPRPCPPAIRPALTQRPLHPRGSPASGCPARRGRVSIRCPSARGP